VNLISQGCFYCYENLRFWLFKLFSIGFGQLFYSHSLKLALYGVNLGLSRVFYKEFDRLFPLRLWSLRKNGIKMVSAIPPEKHTFSVCFIIP